MEEHRTPVDVSSRHGEPAVTMAELLEQSFELKKVQRGEIVTGTIVSISPTEILIDIGSKSEGVVSGRELERLSRENLSELQEGEEVSVYVLRQEDEEDGHVPLSLARAWVEKDWHKAQQMYESGETYEGTVGSYNKGGLIVNFGQVRGFVPVSQLEGNRGITRSGGDEQWSHLVGEGLRLKIIEIDRRRNRLILSERAAMQEWRKEQKQKLLSDLKQGDVITGCVTSLADFGAFVDIGGADGLIHLSELSWAQVPHPREILNVGQEVEVYVLQVDTERQRISLSLKRLEAEPWSKVLEKYEIGQVVDAIITRLASFGAFAQVDEIEGLVHISELTDANITHPREVVSEGENVVVKIIHIEPERRRMGLSLKQAEGVTEWEDFGEDQETGSIGVEMQALSDALEVAEAVVQDETQAGTESE